MQEWKLWTLHTNEWIVVSSHAGSLPDVAAAQCRCWWTDDNDSNNNFLRILIYSRNLFSLIDIKCNEIDEEIAEVMRAAMCVSVGFGWWKMHSWFILNAKNPDT